MSIKGAVKAAIETMTVAASLERQGCLILSANAINAPRIIAMAPRAGRSLFDYRKIHGAPTDINGVRIEWRPA